MSSAAAGMEIISTLSSNLFSLAAAACQLIGSWFIFKKMGKPGWKGIIPFYNIYVLCEELWDKKQFKKYIILTVCCFAISFVSMIFMFIAIFAGVWVGESNGDGGSVGLMIAMIVLTVITFIAMMVFIVLIMIWAFKLYNRIAKAFGKTTGFAVGMLLLSPVFFMILGLDKSTYLGRQVE